MKKKKKNSLRIEKKFVRGRIIIFVGSKDDFISSFPSSFFISPRKRCRFDNVVVVSKDGDKVFDTERGLILGAALDEGD